MRSPRVTTRGDEVRHERVSRRGAVLPAGRGARAPAGVRAGNPPFSTAALRLHARRSARRRTATHFFGATKAADRAAATSSSRRPATAGTVASGQRRRASGFFRVDHRVSQRHRCSEPLQRRSSFGGTTSPADCRCRALGTQYTSDVHTLLDDRSERLRARGSNELLFQFARFGDRSHRPPADGLRVARGLFAARAARWGRTASAPIPRTPGKAADTLSFTQRGHAVKLGGGIEVRPRSQRLPELRPRRVLLCRRARSVPATLPVLQGFAPTADCRTADPRSSSAFGFIQDDWRMPRRTTLNLGLRYDIEQVVQRPQLHRARRQEQRAAAGRRRVGAARRPAAHRARRRRASTRSSTCSTTSTARSSKGPTAR